MNVPGSILKQDIMGIILFYLLAAADLVPAEIFTLTMAVAIFVVLSLNGWRFSKGALVLVLPMGTLLMLGTLLALGNPAYESLKDIWYVAKSVVIVMLGYFIMLHIGGLRRFLQIVVGTSLLLSITYLTEFVRDPALMFSSLREAYVATGGGYILSSIGAGIMLGTPRRSYMSVTRRDWSWVLITAVCITAVWLCWSRTQWILVALLAAILRGWLDRGIRTIVIAMVSVIAIAIMIQTVPVSEQTGPGATFLGKSVYSIKEISVSNYSTKIEVINNFRGYEIYRGLQTFHSGSLFEQIAGQGFGSTVDLGLHMRLAGVEQRYISWLHNGYMYVLVKTGILGLILYVWFLIKPLWIAYSIRAKNGIDIYYARKLLVSIALALLYTSFVFGGFFTKSYLLPLLFMIGGLCAYLSVESQQVQVKYDSRIPRGVANL